MVEQQCEILLYLNTLYGLTYFSPPFAAPVFCLLWLMKHTVDSVYLSAPKEVVGTYGGSVKVTCRYNLRFRDYTKYWCKGRVYDLCRIVVKTPRNRLSDRSSITDNKTAGAFTITTTSLQGSDDDVYWCVIATSGKNVNTRVRLRISHTGMTHTSLYTLFTLLCMNSGSLWQEFIFNKTNWMFFILQYYFILTITTFIEITILLIRWDLMSPTEGLARIEQQLKHENTFI